MKTKIGLISILLVAIVSLAFMGVRINTQTLDFDVATGGATEEFESVQVRGEFITIQILYSGLDAADGSITFTQSIKNDIFDDITPSGTVIVLDNTKTSHTVNFVDLRTNYLQPTWTKGSNTVGTIEKIIYTTRTEH